MNSHMNFLATMEWIEIILVSVKGKQDGRIGVKAELLN